MVIEQQKTETPLEVMKKTTELIENWDVNVKNLEFPTTQSLFRKEPEEIENKNERQTFDMWNIDFEWMYNMTLNKGSKEVQNLLKDVLVSIVFKWKEVPENISFERTETDSEKRIIIHDWNKRYKLSWKWNLRKYLYTE